MLAIILYGVQSPLYSEFKAHLKQKAVEAKINLCITEVNDVLVFLQESIPSIPMIRSGQESRSDFADKENLLMVEAKQWLLLKTHTDSKMK